MSDMIYIVVMIAFFALSVGYARACEKLWGDYGNLNCWSHRSRPLCLPPRGHAATGEIL